VRRLAALAVTALVLLVPAAATAASCPKTSLGDVEDEVMCQVCGTPLELATESPQANRERDLIRRLVAQCKSKQQVKSVLVAQFGKGVLALPGDQSEGGSDLSDKLIYILPAAGFLIAAGGIAVAVRRWRRQRGPSGAPLASASGPQPDTDRLDEDLGRYDL
jgi:cytochrome c-type biogenesis protein CcmH